MIDLNNYKYIEYNNQGKWHIDHVIPDSWFNYSSTKDQGFKDSWSLSNLQPLWAKENISKNNRYSGSFKRKVG